MKILVLFGFMFSLISLTSCSVIHVKDRSEPVIKRNSDTFFSARAQDGEMRRRITVLPFINLSVYQSEDVPREAREYFLSLLKKMDATVVSDPVSLGIENMETYKNGLNYKIPEIVQKIKTSGVHAIVIGTVKDLRTGRRGDSVGIFRRVRSDIKATVELQVISVRSGQVMSVETQVADLSEGTTKVAQRSYLDGDMRDDPSAVRFVVETAFEKTVPSLLESLKKFSWEGRVALVKGERLYLNAGRVSGLQIGDVLRIVEPQEEVFDPENSRSIGSIRGRVKGTVEVVSYFGNDGAVTQIHSGSGFKENDLVEFY